MACEALTRTLSNRVVLAKSALHLTLNLYTFSRRRRFTNSLGCSSEEAHSPQLPSDRRKNIDKSG
jgi:hypothetical protein